MKLGELPRLNMMISLHVKITCYFRKCKDQPPLLWFHNPLKSTLMCCCMIETSSVLHRKSSAFFGLFRKMFGNVCLALGLLLENLRNSSESCRKSSLVCLYNNCGYEFYLLVFNSKIIFVSTRGHVISSNSLRCSNVSYLDGDVFTLELYQPIPFAQASTCFLEFLINNTKLNCFTSFSLKTDIGFKTPYRDVFS